MKLEECIFCECSLEDWEYGRTEDNGERAITSSKLGFHSLSICKSCAKELKFILNADQDANGGISEQ